MRSGAFRAAVEAQDLNGALSCLAPNVLLHSPITFKPFVGRDAVAALFGILFRTFTDFRYVGEFTSPDGAEVLHFHTRVGDRDVEGIDMIRFDGAGLINDFTVMVRPLSAALALRDAVGAEVGATPV